VTDFLELPSPRWLTIAAHRPFLDDLAAGLWGGLSPLDPEALAETTILVPNRRAVRALADALVARSGRRAILPPQMRALGDLDEGEPPFEPGDLALDLPPAIGAERRRFELAGIVAANAHLLERPLSAVSALDLADALARFLDACQIEEVAQPIDVESLVEGDLAQHWRKSADFLSLARDAWPKRLAELGMMDLTERRVMLLRRLEARWREAPPSGVLIAAGSTGSTPATAGLLAAVAGAPRGCVVLPGLDLSLADGAWAAVGDQHPQGALKRLLEGAGVTRAQVDRWPGSAEVVDAARWRRRVISEALRPADRTADWLQVIGEIRAEAGTGDGVAEGLSGLSLVSARTEDEAASAAALMLREALDTPGRTAALVTPDAALARRVMAALARWNIVPDSSVGQSLAASPTGVLAGLVARQSVDPVDPVGLLAIVKHPLVGLGFAPEALESARRDLERRGLRGPRPRDWQALRELIESEAALKLADDLEAAFAIAGAPFASGEATPAEAARALAESLEALAAGPGGGTDALWAGQAGAAVAAVITSLMDETEALPPVTRAGFRDLLDGLLARAETRPGGASHPRLRVLGVLEARLVRSDLLILAGLEEGVWPALAPIDPFLSRPMREKLGLPAPERRIGLAAHDFAQAACAPDVVLLTCERRGGSPTVESRWLWRLRTLIAGAKLEPPGRPEVLDWARALDAPILAPNGDAAPTHAARRRSAA